MARRDSGSYPTTPNRFGSRARAPDLAQEAALAAAGIADDDSSRDATVCGRTSDLAERSELVYPADEHAHVPKRTTNTTTRASSSTSVQPSGGEVGERESS